jgi:hypothetical protein
MAYWADVLHPAGETSRQATEWPEHSRRVALPRQVSAVAGMQRDARLLRLASQFAVGRLVPDVAAYFFNPRVRAAIRSRLLDVLATAAGPYVVIAHSMGTIVAYDVLHALGDVIDVRLWVTLGSPLGITAVQNRLAQPLSVPHGVREWRNFADRLDPVAFDRTLSGEFEPAGFVRDEWIINPGTLAVDAFNPHSGTGYLSHPAVRDAVNDALGDDRLAEATGMNPVAHLPASADVETYASTPPSERTSA